MTAYDLPPERLERWLERWAALHGGVARTAVERDAVTFAGADGATVRCEPPFPPLDAIDAVEADAAPADADTAPADGDAAPADPDAAAAPAPASDAPAAAGAAPVGAPFGPLLAHVRRRRIVGVVLVRLGGYAVGIFEGDELTASKVGSRLVHGRHRAGGSSAKRFARRRENQARVALDAAAETAVAILAGPARAGVLDAVVRGGDRRALVEVFEDGRLAGVARLAVERVIDVPEPRLKVLRAAPEQFLATRVVPSDGP